MKAWLKRGVVVLEVFGSLAGLGDLASAQGGAARVPLYTDLGDHAYAITTSVPDAQKYFDQGLRLYYGFNHQEAIRSFREAQRLDPGCAMCWWGEAISWGPNINLAMDEPSGRAAYAAVQEALARRGAATEKERALIDALAVRYAEEPPAERAALDQAYADAMGVLARRYATDHEIGVLYAESLMDLRPWNYWTEDGRLQPGMDDALARLEAALASNARHPGACHFFIHAVEKVQPERAVPCAERLAALMPGAGHIVHMPGHIYIRVGRYEDAVRLNEHAVHADESYIRDQQPGLGMYTAGYYPHNYDFMAFAATMIGRSGDAVRAAERVASLIPSDMFGTPGMDFLQHWTMRPTQVRVRFARWGEVLAQPAPSESMPHARALWHYGRGRALAATGDVAGARRELEQLRTLAASSALDGMRLEFNPAREILRIADRVLTAWVQVADRRFDAAVAAAEEAVRLEDALLYGEPPEWTVPTRQDLGAVLLAAGRPADAEQAFRGDLDRFPANGWSLHGLAAALRAQGRADEAAAVEADFRRVWQSADVEPAALAAR